MKQLVLVSLAASAFAGVVPRDSCKADACFSAVNPSVCAPYQTRTRYLTTETVYATVTSAGLQVRDKGRGGGRIKSEDRPHSEDRTRTFIAPSSGFTTTFTVTNNYTVPYPTGTGIADSLRRRAPKGGDDKTKTITKTRGGDDDDDDNKTSGTIHLPTVTGIDDSGHFGQREKGDKSKTRSRTHGGDDVTLAPTITASANTTLPIPTSIDDSGNVGKRAADKGKDDGPGDDRTSTSSSSEDNTSRTSSVDDRTFTQNATTTATGLPFVTGCRGDSKVKSACSCIGITSTTITLPTSTRTRTLTTTAPLGHK